MNKFANVNMSYDVTDEEKTKAKKALTYFNFALKKLKSCNKFLDLLKTPFKDQNGANDNEAIMKARASFRKYRDKALENFNMFKKAAFNCVNSMQLFGSDTQTIKLMKSFISSVDNLEIKISDFKELFDNLQDKDFSKNIVDIIEKIQEKSEEISSIISERVIPHIKTNILASTWVDSIGDELKVKIDKKVPLLLELYNARQKELNNKMKG